MPGRDLSKVFIAIIKPKPSLPSMFSFGTLQFVKISSLVAELLMPSFFSFLPNSKPGVPFSTINTLAPREPFDLSVIATTV